MQSTSHLLFVGSTRQPFLEILVEPSRGPYRFRYASELRTEYHGSIKGVDSDECPTPRKTFPTVKLNNFNFAISTIIRCSLYQLSSGLKDRRKTHFYRLIQRNKFSTGSVELEIGIENEFTAV